MRKIETKRRPLYLRLVQRFLNLPSIAHQHISNRIGSLSFHLILLMFSLYVHNNIDQNLWHFARLWNVWINLWLSQIGHKWKFWGFRPFLLKAVTVWPWNFIHRHILGTFSLLKYGPRGHIFGPYLTSKKAKIHFSNWLLGTPKRHLGAL